MSYHIRSEQILNSERHRRFFEVTYKSESGKISILKKIVAAETWAAFQKMDHQSVFGQSQRGAHNVQSAGELLDHP